MRQKQETQQLTEYKRANPDWPADCTLGIGVHWTAQTAPREGKRCSFQKAVDDFKIEDFLSSIKSSGADYVIFTAAHALQMLPCPHPILDGILPDRTAERDLLGEIAAGLAAIGKNLIVYYNHSCNHGDDPAWEQAVRYHDQNKEHLADNLCSIVRWMGDTYGELIRGWWFDSSYSLDPTGPHNAVTTDMAGFRFPWEKFTVAAKSGFADRLVTYNAGIGETHLYTTHQDYWAGEQRDLNAPPTSRYLPNGLRWHGWTCLDDRRWVYADNSSPSHPPLYTDDEILSFLSECRNHQAPMCFNVISFQSGELAHGSVQQLNRVSRLLATQDGARSREKNSHSRQEQTDAR